MSPVERVDLLMQETARLLSGAAVSCVPREGVWRAAFDDKTCLVVEHEPTLNRLVLSVPVGEVAEHAKLRVYEMLLQYNALWPDTGGVRMALDGAPGSVVMFLDLPAAEVDAGRICEVLTNMASIRRAWSGILDAHSSPREAQASRVS